MPIVKWRLRLQLFCKQLHGRSAWLLRAADLDDQRDLRSRHGDICKRVLLHRLDMQLLLRRPVHNQWLCFLDLLRLHLRHGRARPDCSAHLASNDASTDHTTSSNDAATDDTASDNHSASADNPSSNHSASADDARAHDARADDARAHDPGAYDPGPDDACSAGVHDAQVLLVAELRGPSVGVVRLHDRGVLPGLRGQRLRRVVPAGDLQRHHDLLQAVLGQRVRQLQHHDRAGRLRDRPRRQLLRPVQRRHAVFLSHWYRQQGHCLECRHCVGRGACSVCALLVLLE
jgi:hypothetical protein